MSWVKINSVIWIRSEESLVLDKQKIYLMTNHMGLHKIGISANPRKRAMDIANSSGFPTTLVCQWHSFQAYRTEQFLHKHFSDKRNKGEWFKLTKRDIASIPKVIDSVDRLIPISLKGAEHDHNILPCHDPIRVIESVANRAPSNTDEIDNVREFQYRQLRDIRKNSIGEFEKVIKILSEAGYYIPYAWRIERDNATLGSFVCNFISKETPIFSEVNRLIALRIYSEDAISGYKEALDIENANFIKLDLKIKELQEK